MRTHKRSMIAAATVISVLLLTASGVRGEANASYALLPQSIAWGTVQLTPVATGGIAVLGHAHHGYLLTIETAQPEIRAYEVTTIYVSEGGHVVRNVEAFTRKEVDVRLNADGTFAQGSVIHLKTGRGSLMGVRVEALGISYSAVPVNVQVRQ